MYQALWVVQFCCAIVSLVQSGVLSKQWTNMGVGYRDTETWLHWHDKRAKAPKLVSLQSAMLKFLQWGSKLPVNALGFQGSACAWTEG